MTLPERINRWLMPSEPWPGRICYLKKTPPEIVKELRELNKTMTKFYKNNELYPSDWEFIKFV